MAERVPTNPVYRCRVAKLLKLARERAGLGPSEMAALVSVEATFTTPITGEEWLRWEDVSDAVAVPTAALLAALHMAGVEHVGELEGTLPDPTVTAETENALDAIRLLVNDPTALRRRARRLEEANRAG